jgi:hypothetical protein
MNEEPGIHEKMGPVDEAAWGPVEPAWPDLTDPAVRNRLKADIAAAEKQPSPHILRGTKHEQTIRNMCIALEEIDADLIGILLDPTVRGVPRDALQLVAVELRRNAPRLYAAVDG